MKIFQIIILLIPFSIVAQDYALDFDGDDDQVAVFWNREPQWSVLAWIKHTGNWSVEEYAVGAYYHAKSWVKSPIAFVNGIPSVQIGKETFSMGKDALDSGWHHIAATYDSHYLRMYVDGKMTGHKAVKSLFAAPSHLGSGDGEKFFKGQIDEVQFWSSALSEDIIKNWMSKSLDGTHPNYKDLNNYYPLNTSDEFALDYIGNKHGFIQDANYQLPTDGGPKYVKNDRLPLESYSRPNLPYESYSSINNSTKQDFIEQTETRPNAIVVRALAWNIWHGGKEQGSIKGLKRVVDIIEDSGADVVMMVETYGSGPNIAKQLEFHYHPFGKEGSNLSILSRYPIEKLHESDYDSFKSGGATILLPNGRKAVFYTVWLHYGYDISLAKYEGVTAEHLVDNDKAFEDIRQIFKQDILKLVSNESTPIILGGDFNNGSHRDWTDDTAKLWNLGLEVRFPNSIFLENHDFIDSYREVHPNPVTHPGFTWSPLYGYNHPGDRIDFMYYKGNGIRVLNSFVINTYRGGSIPFPSDHAAVLTIFEFENIKD